VSVSNQAALSGPYSRLGAPILALPVESRYTTRPTSLSQAGAARPVQDRRRNRSLPAAHRPGRAGPGRANLRQTRHVRVLQIRLQGLWAVGACVDQVIDLLVVLEHRRARRRQIFIIVGIARADKSDDVLIVDGIRR
jgi:hypothetical protein